MSFHNWDIPCTGILKKLFVAINGVIFIPHVKNISHLVSMGRRAQGCGREKLYRRPVVFMAIVGVYVFFYCNQYDLKKRRMRMI